MATKGSEPLPESGLGHGASAASAVPGAPQDFKAHGAPHAPNTSNTSNAPNTSNASNAPNAPAPVSVRAITVKTGRLVCEVAIPDQKHRHTTSRLAAFVCEYYPDLPHHACVNDCGNTFGCVMERTSVPHLLEHLAISLQVRASESIPAIAVSQPAATSQPAAVIQRPAPAALQPASADQQSAPADQQLVTAAQRPTPSAFVGTSEWLDEAAGIARVQVSFQDDLEALRAFNEATRFLNIAVVTCLP